MGELSERSETIAAYLAGRCLGAEVTRFDTNGRQSAVDFILTWPDGRRGALEVTLVTDPESSKWQGQAVSDGWRWPASTSWEFRLSGEGMRYRETRDTVLRAVELCDRWEVETPELLPRNVLDQEAAIVDLATVGKLRRVPFSPGVRLLPAVRTEFLDASTSDFAAVVEGWLNLPHMPPHVEKLIRAEGVVERHLFLVPVDEVLPARFFTNDFPVPARVPRGYGGVDGVWVWSNFWHQFLVLRSGVWRWHDFPVRQPSDE